MSEPQQTLSILMVVGNRAKKSKTRTVMHRLREFLEQENGPVDCFDCAEEDMPLFNVEEAYDRPAFANIRQRILQADAYVLGTPDYHGSMSSALKNFLDHFWKEFAGKFFASVVGSHEKGLTVHDQIRTVARQCYAWSLPYGVSFHELTDLDENQRPGEKLESNLRMMASDVVRYGKLLKGQRSQDLAGDYPGFLARHRK